MERKSYLQFSMKGEEPSTSESPSAQTVLPASRFSHRLPPPPPLPTFPSSPTESSPGGQRELPNSPVSPESWSWSSLWWGQEREKCRWWKAEGSCQPWPWCWEPRVWGWGERHPGLQDAVKLLPVLGDRQRGCVGLLGVRHGGGETGMFLGYPMHWCFSFCTERQERSEERGRWCQRDERRDVGRHATVAVGGMSSQTWSSYQTVTFVAEMLVLGAGCSTTSHWWSQQWVMQKGNRGSARGQRQLQKDLSVLTLSQSD